MSQSAFEKWWHEEGSHLATEEGVRQACETAWSNGAFKSDEELANLRDGIDPKVSVPNRGELCVVTVAGVRDILTYYGVHNGMDNWGNGPHKNVTRWWPLPGKAAK